MDYLKESFRLTRENNERKEKMKKTVDQRSTLLAILVRPSLSAEQNEVLSSALEEIVSVCSICSYNVGYNEALQSFAEAKLVTEPNAFPQQ